MKNRYKFLGLLGLLPFFAFGQLTNNGATIVIEQGATLVVEGNIDNTTGSVITNSGILEVKGNFTNDGTLTSTATNADIVFSGTAAQNFDSNGASVRKVSITNTTANVNLLNTGLTITDELAFGTSAANLDIADQDLNLGSGASITGAGTGSYIEADGVGQVVKTYGSTGLFNFPIGDASVYSPLSADVTAGTVGSSTLAVNVTNAAHANMPSDANNPNRNATEYITRYWNIEQTGFGAGFSANVLGTYDDIDDVVQTSGENLIKAAMWDQTEWSYDDTNNTATNQVGATITGSRELTGSNTFGKSMVSVILGGAYDSGTGLMRTDLNGGSTGILANNALTSPYGTGETVTAGFFDTHSTIVDWVLIELRDGAANTSVITSRSAFVLSNGSLLDITGGTDNDVLYFKNAPASSYVVIKHRNHLGIMLNTTNNYLTSVGDVDFRASGTVTYGSNAQRPFDSKTMMWYGDASSDGLLDYDGTGINELAFLQNTILTHPDNTGFGGIQLGRIIEDVYHEADLNLDGMLDYDGVGLNELALLQNAILTHLNNSGFGGIQLGRLITEELPEHE